MELLSHHTMIPFGMIAMRDNPFCSNRHDHSFFLLSAHGLHYHGSALSRAQGECHIYLDIQATDAATKPKAIPH